jgi:hypothetical protein
MCLSSPKPPPPPPPIPQKEDANVARVRELRRRSGARGFPTTISPGTLLGSIGTVPQPAIVKTLLGM